MSVEFDVIQEMPIYTATSWKDNGEMIADVARLGYIDGLVLDCTYGLGRFWTEFIPDLLTGTDINLERSPLGIPIDFTDMPFENQSYDTVVYDPPYRLSGTPDRNEDSDYGIEQMDWQERYDLLLTGLVECCRVAKKRILAKCMDQVCNNAKRFQTFDFMVQAGHCGFKLIDRFDMLKTPPWQRSQVHSRQNYSTLLIFEREN